MENNIKIKLFLDERENGIVQPTGTVGTQNLNDFFVNIPLTREIKIFDRYIDVQKDPLRLDMQRQFINPWFIEFGFFEGLKSTGITAGTTNNTSTIVPSNQNLIKKAEIFSITINR
jgi:hypothetical protein